LKDLRVITIKNGKNTGRLMAFAKLEDFTGTMELVFFSSLWERKGPELRENAVAAFRGTIGSTKDGTGSSFQVEDVLDPDSLEQKTLKEVHIELRPFFSDDTDLYSLRESLFNAQGDCEIYFHFPQEKERRVIRAHTGLRIPGSPEFIAELSRSCPLVGNVWTA
jgi:DNA polymerase-3 subunit alpha